MDNHSLRDEFRNQFTNLHALTVLTVSLFEIIGYMILVESGVEFFSLRNRYLWYGVVFPIVINVLTHAVARLLVNDKKLDRHQKNKAIILAALVTSLVVAVVHKEYIVTSCAFIFPMILSAVFNDKKLLNLSFGASLFILVAVGAAFYIEDSITLLTSINLFILSGFSFISYQCGILSVDFSQKNYSTIESQAAENDKLWQVVLKDQMTGLYNHNAFITHLDMHIEAFEKEVPLHLVMFDVDNFKHINDNYGHDCGDEVLIFLAKTMQEHCTESESAYRYGGEEFAILFLGKSYEDVIGACENILEKFSSHTFGFTDEKITFSAGVAEYHSGMARDEFFEKADKTLYKAKKEGKNRVLLSK